MSLLSRIAYKGSYGKGGKWVLAILAVAVGVTIYVLFQIGPVYQEKWRFEDYMEENMRRLRALGEDGIFELLDNYAVDNKIPVRPDEDCVFEGDLGHPGTMECNYEVTVKFPKYDHVMHVRAYKYVPRIPSTSH